MSHNTKLEVQVTNKNALCRVALKHGMTVETRDSWVNKYSHERVENPTVLVQEGGAVKMAIDKAGMPVVDPYYMGYEHQAVLRDYSAEVLKERATLNGATFREVGQTEAGSLIVEIETR